MASNKDQSATYSLDMQKLFLEIMVYDPQCYVRVQNIYNPENFNKELKAASKFIQTYAEKYAGMPSTAQINAETNTKLQNVPAIDNTTIEWFLDEFERFSKHKAINRAILESVDLLENGDYDPIEKMIKDAVQISLTRDLGINYFDDPRGRLMRLKGNNGQVSTGWLTLDRPLFGGFNRGELEIFAGTSGAGKSLFLQNLAVNWMTAGLNGVYITLELSADLCSMRMDSMHTNISSKEIFRHIDDIELKLGMINKKAGVCQIKYLPAQSNINDIRSYIKELQIQTGVEVDYIIVDYLDQMMPASIKVNPSDLFVKDKYVSEELRNLAQELRVVMVSASQLGRGAVEEVEFDHTHIAGGISKINTSDNVFGIFTSRSMREHGRYQLQLMKTRSSSGLGQKVDLEFNPDTLRIRDLPVDEQESSPIASSILPNIKKNSTVLPAEDKKIVAEIQNTKLKEMLANLKK